MSTSLVRFDQLIKNFEDAFYSFPSGAKPPLDYVYLVDKNGVTEGVEIQLALAGFREKDIKVWREGSVILISGNNKENENLSEKFTCAFERAFSINRSYDLDNLKIIFEDGLLRIGIPIAKHMKIKQHLFGDTS